MIDDINKIIDIKIKRFCDFIINLKTKTLITLKYIL